VLKVTKISVKGTKICEIWTVRLSDAVGHEQSGQRPAIVCASIDSIGIAFVIPLTTQLDASRFPLTLKIEKSPENGLDEDSIAMIFQARALSYNRFVRRRGVIEVKYHELIKALLKKYLNI